jgi:hypothetical protein
MSVAVFWLHLLSTIFMTGVIWFVQIVHYPLFDHVSRQDFTKYEMRHMQRTTWVVAPAMLIELMTGIVLVALARPGLTLTLATANLLLLGVVWTSTWFLQVPRHRVLADGFNGVAHQSLVRGNWVRTAAWSMRSVLVLWLVTAMGHA